MPNDHGSREITPEDRKRAIDPDDPVKLRDIAEAAARGWRAATDDLAEAKDQIANHERHYDQLARQLRQADLRREQGRIREAELRQRLATAEAIVRDLGGIKDPSFGESCCGFCVLSVGVREFTDPARHNPECEWRRAVEWVSTQETDDE